MKTPPFNPPYMTFEDRPEGLRITEVLADGTTRIVPETEALRFMRAPQQGSAHADLPKKAQPPASSAPAPSPRPLAQGNDRAMMYLDVRFAEKDEAKRLGAKWDQATRKWYLPHGVDINLFRRWWPEALRHETAGSDQL